MKAINQEKQQEVGVAQRDYKWYPYFFTLNKYSDEYSIENTCYYNKAISVINSLVDSWDNLPHIRREMNNMAQMLGFFQTFSESAEAEEGEQEEIRYNILLKEIGPNKLKVIKAIRELTDMSFKDAKDNIDRAPIVLFKGVSKADANKIIESIEEAGGKCDIMQD